MGKTNEIFKNPKFSATIFAITTTNSTNGKEKLPWKQKPFHPSLEFKIVKPKENIWSVRIGIGWRALGVMRTDEDKIVWFWVGSHAEYDKILAKR